MYCCLNWNKETWINRLGERDNVIWVSLYFVSSSQLHDPGNKKQMQFGIQATIPFCLNSKTICEFPQHFPQIINHPSSKIKERAVMHWTASFPHASFSLSFKSLFCWARGLRSTCNGSPCRNTEFYFCEACSFVSFINSEAVHVTDGPSWCITPLDSASKQ